MASSRIIFIMGMHRSGTSAVTRGITALGVRLSDDLLPPTPGNPKGYFESRTVMQINDQLLRCFGANWTTPRLTVKYPLSEARKDFERPMMRMRRFLEKLAATHEVVALKDPRLCNLGPLWFETAAALGIAKSVVLVCRNPAAIANSLARRNSFSLARTADMWLGHLSEALSYQPEAVIDYDLLLDRPRHELKRLAMLLQLPFPDERSLSEFADEFLDENLRRSGGVPGTIMQQLAKVRSEIPALWEKLSFLSGADRDIS